MHHSLPSFISTSLRDCTNLSLLPCGRRGTACGGGYRTRWLMTMSRILVLYVAPPCQSVRLAGYHPPLTRSPLFKRKRALVRCITHCFLSIELTHELVLPQASFHVEGGGPRAVEDGELACSLEYPTHSLPSLHCPAYQWRATLQCLAN